MDNQHLKIKGYRDFSQAEIDAVNEVKAEGQRLGALVEKLRAQPGLDQSLVTDAAKDLRDGIMLLARSITQPTTF